MPELAVALAWTLLVGFVLLRLVRQGRFYAATSLPRRRRLPVTGSVTVVVPARDEIANIDICLNGLLRQRGLAENYEVVVVDDGSTDGTAACVKRLAAGDKRLRLVSAGPLPQGWLGKPYACWRGAAASRARWLCFVDADLRATPHLVATAIAASKAQGIDLLSVSPFQELGGFWERLIVPSGMLLIGCAMDLRRVDDPAASDVTANGQFLLFRGDAYRALGGHRAVRGEICEDKALARLCKRRGLRFRLLGGEHLARARLYRDLSSLWQGLAKNAVEILGSGAASVAAASAAALIAWAALLLPLGAALRAADPSGSSLAALALCLCGSLALFAMQLGAVRHSRAPAAYALLFPAAYGAIAALAWTSLALRWAGRVTWKGRTYEIERKAAPPSA
ncbi:MAG TPA: glycosyltransferase family 2 protein [Stellaceae bacterium]|nr:glycosyltransferase family 2 protein [Stellaceae bacterium]